MQKLFYSTLKMYVHFSLHLFFKKIRIVGSENIPKKDPVLFLPNHQNALIDALLIVTHNSLKTHFVARADVFKQPTIKKMLSWLYMRPIYRIRDGRAALKLNEEIFSWCIDVLSKKDALVMFPEGNHSLQRKVRPLSKGFTRIVFGALEKYPTLNLKIVPIGLNYSDHKKIGSSVSIYYGEPIDAQEYLNFDDRQRVQKLKEKVSAELKKLTTHIPEENYELQLSRLKAEKIDFLDPVEANKLIAETGSTASKPKLSPLKFLAKLIQVPIFINSILLIGGWHLMKGIIKDHVMTATIKFSYGIVAVPLVYALQAGILSYYTRPSYGVIYFIISILSIKLLKE